MGVVYLAERDDLGSLAAIKILRDAWLSPARRERFAAEQRTLAQLNHPSIARLYDADTLADGTPWFVDGVRRGRAAHRLLPRRAARRSDERLRLFRAVCEAVQHAHRHAGHPPRPQAVEHPGHGRRHGEAARLRHRQAARERRRAGGPDPHRPAADDAGLRRARADPRRARRASTPTSTRSASSCTSCSPAAAVRSVGPDPGEAESIILEHEPERPSRGAGRVGQARSRRRDRQDAWADLDVLCLTAMHKDPARRYQTVEALIRDIDHYLPASRSKRGPTARAIGRQVRRGATGAPVVAAAAALSLVVGLVGVLHRAR